MRNIAALSSFPFHLVCESGRARRGSMGRGSAQAARTAPGVRRPRFRSLARGRLPIHDPPAQGRQTDRSGPSLPVGLRSGDPGRDQRGTGGGSGGQELGQRRRSLRHQPRRAERRPCTSAHRATADPDHGLRVSLPRTRPVPGAGRPASRYLEPHRARHGRRTHQDPGHRRRRARATGHRVYRGHANPGCRRGAYRGQAIASGHRDRGDRRDPVAGRKSGSLPRPGRKLRQRQDCAAGELEVPGTARCVAGLIASGARAAAILLRCDVRPPQRRGGGSCRFRRPARSCQRRTSSNSARRGARRRERDMGDITRLVGAGGDNWGTT